MAEANLILGATLDIASGAEVEKAVQSASDRVLRRLDKDRKLRNRPTKSYSITPAATGTFVLELGGPPAGTVWEMVEVVVTGKDDREAPAGAVSALYAGSPARQLTATTITDAPVLSQLMRPAQAIPSLFVFGGEDYTIHNGETLFVVIYSLTTAMTVMSATATVMQVNSSAVSLDRI